jgi:hypothetical protein
MWTYRRGSSLTSMGTHMPKATHYPATANWYILSKHGRFYYPTPPSAKKKALPGTWVTPTSTLEAASCISPELAEAWSLSAGVPFGAVSSKGEQKFVI